MSQDTVRLTAINAKNKTHHTHPSEIVLRLLQITYVADYEPLLNCLQVCRKWYNLGADLPWRDLYVNDANVISTYKALNTASLQNRARVRSITTETSSFPGGSREPSYKTLPLLFSCLHRLPQLECIAMNDHIKSFRGDNNGPAYRISACLSSIPLTVRNLSVNGPLSDKHMNFGPHIHICEQIRQLLPQLQRLRLHNVAICSGLFDGGIRSDTLQDGNIIDFKYHFKDSQEAYGPGSPFYKRGLDKFLEAAQGSIRNGRLPELQNFTICGGGHGLVCVDDPVYAYRWRVDAKNNKSAIWPVAVYTPPPESDFDEDTYIWIRYSSSPNCQYIDLCEAHYDGWLDRLIDGESWATSLSTKIRQPKALQATRDYHNWKKINLQALIKECKQHKSNPKNTPLEIWFC